MRNIDSRRAISALGRLPIFALFVLLGLMTVAQTAADAATSLSVTPITWNVVGLDSNNVNVGPNDFPVGARVCNTGASTAVDLSGTFVWDNTPAPNYINLRPGTLSTVTAGNLAPGACTELYYEVEVTRNSAAYDTTRNYHIAVTADSGATTGSTPVPRQIYVEHLISQSRNSVTAMSLSTDGVSYSPVDNGGTMTLVVGNTYWIKLDSSTATNGYNQLESFINFPNTIFQVLSASTDYSADSSLPADGGYVPDPNDTLYADGCLWNNNPSSPGYRSCTGIDGKAGGTITTIYRVKILSMPNSPLPNPEPLNTLVYDFSGSSYHYNSDFSTTVRYAQIVSPATLTKAFSPNTITSGNATLTYTITSISSNTLSNVNFADTTGWPAGMTVNSVVASYSGCGSPDPTPTPALSVGATSASFGNITLSPNGTCTIGITVTAPNGTYPDVTNDLFIDTMDTGSKGTATLVVSSLPTPPSTCGTATNLATWSLENYTAATTTNNGPFTYSAKASDIAVTTTATYVAQGASTSGIASTTTGPTGWTLPGTTGATGNSWGIRSGWLAANPATPLTATTPYFQFRVDGASAYGGIGLTASYNLQGNWSNSGNWYLQYSLDGSTWNALNTAVWNKQNPWQVNAITGLTSLTGVNTVYFRIFFAGAQNATAAAYLDNVTVYGCPRPVPPTLAKSFSPTTIGADSTDPTINTTLNYSTLTFTIANPGTTALTGVNFSDTLPTGLVIANPPTVSAIACTTGTLTGTVTATAGSSTISLTGGSLAASATGCSFSVRVQGKAAGAYTNTSNAIGAAETGINTGGANVGYGSANLTVIDPPAVSKVFGTTTLLTGQTTALTFTLHNPNASTALSGVQFVGGDTLPAGLAVSTPNGLTAISCSSGSLSGATIGATAGSSSITLTGGTLSAGATCSFSVNVTGTATGVQKNSVQVSATTAGTGNTSSASVLVKNQTSSLKLLKQVGLSSTGPWSSFVTVPTPLPRDVYFRYSVENTGDTPLTNVRVNDSTLPGLDLSNCTSVLSGGLALYETKECVSGAAAVSATGAYSNTADATSNEAVASDSTVRYATEGLILIKSATESSFSAAGNLIHYSYNVYNNSAAPLAGPVTVSDNKVSVTCPNVNTVGNFDANLDPGEGVTCTATYTVTAGDVTAGFVTNTATATAGGVNSNTDSRTVYSSTAVLADLAISKTDGITSVNAGGSTTYTVTVTNNGPSEVTNATVVDAAPAGLTIGSWSCAVTNAGTGGAVTTACGSASGTGNINTTVTMKDGAVITYTVNATVAGSATGSITNTATVTVPGGVIDPTPGNNSSSDTDTITPIADVTTTVTVPAGPVNAGSTVNGTVTFSNNGPSTAAGVTYSFTMSAGLGTVSFPSLPGGVTASYNNTNGVVTLTGMPGSLTSGQTLSIDLSYTAPATGPVNVNTTIGTTTSQGANAAPDSASGSTAITPIADVTTTVTVPASANAGSTVNGTVTFSNNGPSTAAGVTYSFTMSAGLGTVSFPSLPGGVTASYNNTNGVVTLTGMPGSLTSGQTLSIDLSYTAPATGPVNVNSTIGTTTSQGANVAPDSASGSTTIHTPSISITKKTNGTDNDTAPGPTLTVGDSVTWTYEVTNTGDVTLTNVTVSDDKEGSVCIVASLAAGASTTCSKTGTVVAGQYTNIGSVQALDPTAQQVTSSNPDNYFGAVPPPLDCDADGNGTIDVNDINAIFAARDLHVGANDKRDLDKDGLITINDARGCVLRCTNPQCAP